ncbi:MAG: FAD-binding protein, partial [Gallionellaceae bacterium]|nr:FAD-binding protein [Gallionellaceae bacterium]
AALHNLCSAEFFAGIPGTVGGMLAMNAGCYGSTTWDVVARVQVMTRSGELIERAPGEYEVGYRHVTLKEMGEGSPRKGEADGSPTASPLPVRTWEKGKNLGADGVTLPSDETSSHSTRRAHNARQVAGYSLFPLPQEFFVGAWLRLPAGDGSVARGKIKELLTRRIASQPLNLPNAGSVFRNPPGDYAARLIEQCMLKGRQIGGARVSEKHANFIVNMGDATAADIESLINEVQAMVLQKIGIELHPEVRIVGEAAE